MKTISEAAECKQNNNLFLIPTNENKILVWWENHLNFLLVLHCWKYLVEESVDLF